MAGFEMPNSRSPKALIANVVNKDKEIRLGDRT
jgi:hypothetical protein